MGAITDAECKNKKRATQQPKLIVQNNTKRTDAHKISITPVARWGGDTRAPTPPSGVREAFNGAHCASNLVLQCEQNMLEPHTSDKHANNRSASSPSSSSSSAGCRRARQRQKVLPPWLRTDTHTHTHIHTPSLREAKAQ